MQPNFELMNEQVSAKYNQFPIQKLSNFSHTPFEWAWFSADFDMEISSASSSATVFALTGVGSSFGGVMVAVTKSRFSNACRVLESSKLVAFVTSAGFSGSEPLFWKLYDEIPVLNRLMFQFNKCNLHQRRGTGTSVEFFIFCHHTIWELVLVVGFVQTARTGVVFGGGRESTRLL